MCTDPVRMDPKRLVLTLAIRFVLFKLKSCSQLKALAGLTPSGLEVSFVIEETYAVPILTGGRLTGLADLDIRLDGKTAGLQWEQTGLHRYTGICSSLGGAGIPLPCGLPGCGGQSDAGGKCAGSGRNAGGRI